MLAFVLKYHESLHSSIHLFTSHDLTLDLIECEDCNSPSTIEDEEPHAGTESLGETAVEKGRRVRVESWDQVG